MADGTPRYLKRRDITDVSDESLYWLNNMLRGLFYAVGGDIGMANLSGAMKNIINSKVGADNFSSMIQQHADSITLAVGQIGGQNLVQNSNARFGTEDWTGATLCKIKADNTIVAASSTQEGLPLCFGILGAAKGATSARMDVFAQTKYTLCFKAKQQGACKLRVLVRCVSDPAHTEADTTFVALENLTASDGPFKRYSYTFQTPAQARQVWLQFACVNTSGGAGGVGWYEVMLQEGEKATGYTPGSNELRTSAITILQDLINFRSKRMVFEFLREDGSPAMTMSADEAGFDNLLAEDVTATDLTVKNSMSLAGRPLMTAGARDYYVAKTAQYGKPDGDGSNWANANTSVQAILDKLPRVINHDIAIHLYPNIFYDEVVAIAGFLGTGSITIRSGSTPRPYIRQLFINHNQPLIKIDSIGIGRFEDSAAGHGITVSYCPRVEIVGCHFYGGGNYASSTESNAISLVFSTAFVYNNVFKRWRYPVHLSRLAHCTYMANDGSSVMNRFFAAEGAIMCLREMNGHLFPIAAGGPVYAADAVIQGPTQGYENDAVIDGVPNPPPPPKREHTTNFRSTDTKSWRTTSVSGGSQWQPNAYIYQGNYQGYGNHKGMIFFDIASIRSTLAGATINAVTLTIRRRSQGGSSAAGALYAYTHNYASRPAGNAEPALGAAIGQIGAFAWGSQQTVGLPTWVAERMRDGSAAGILFHAPGGSPYLIFEGWATLDVNYTK
nr:hypothetical protein [Maliibacterium massiliense]